MKKHNRQTYHQLIRRETNQRLHEHLLKLQPQRDEKKPEVIEVSQDEQEIKIVWV